MKYLRIYSDAMYLMADLDPRLIVNDLICETSALRTDLFGTGKTSVTVKSIILQTKRDWYTKCVYIGSRGEHER